MLTIPLSILALGAAGLAVTPAHAAPGDDFADLSAALASCPGTTGSPTIVSLTADVGDGSGTLTIGCVAVIELGNSTLKARTITIDSGQRLTVQSSSGTGRLDVDASGTTYTPGISNEGATLVVKSGRIDVQGAAGAPGIGGGYWVFPGNGRPAGTTIVEGGTVYASGGGHGAGIGTGYEGGGLSAGTLTVSGGEVYAYGGASAAGVGGGGTNASGYGAGSGAQVTVTGGALFAYGGSGGAGIGGGYTPPQFGHGGSGGSLTASGGTVTAEGGSGAAGIGGGGNDGDAGDVQIDAGATVAATGGADAPAIGGAKDSTDFGSLSVDGTLRMSSGIGLRLPAGTDVVVGSTGQIRGRIPDPADGGTISGAGQITNNGAILLSAGKVSATVLNHNYLVSFDGAGGSPIGAVRVFASTFDAGYRTLPTPTRALHTFTGWRTLPAGGGTPVTATTTLSGPFVAFAQWTANTVTVAKPAIDGDAVVDQQLTVTPPVVTPADATLDYTWYAGAGEVGTGPTYTVKPLDVGHAITVKVDATKTDYTGDTATSDPTATVVKADFATGPSASFTGVLKVGEELTAATGTVSPTPGSFAYQWFAGDDPIGGATEGTYTLTPDEKGAPISVRVTAIRDGYHDAVDTSDPSAPVATNLAPGLTLKASASSLRLGRSTTLTWSSEDADTVVASGAWSGALTAAGRRSVTPARTGTTTYVLTATNDNGSTTAQVATRVTLPPATLKVSAPRKTLRGKKIKVRASGLAPAEAYTIKVGRVTVASGHADGAGRVRKSVRVSAKAGKRTIRVTGSLRDRTGTTRIGLIRLKPLRLTLASPSVRASDDQVLTVRNLRPRERVVVDYNGRRISSPSARADRRGVYTLRFDVDVYWGVRTVSVTGKLDGRTSSASFTVTQRCPTGVPACD